MSHKGTILALSLGDVVEAPRRNASFLWTPQVIEELRQLWDEGHSTAEIGRRLGTTKNAIVGKAGRLNLPSRPSPILRDGETKQRPVRLTTNTLPLLPSATAGQPQIYYTWKTPARMALLARWVPTYVPRVLICAGVRALPGPRVESDGLINAAWKDAGLRRPADIRSNLAAVKADAQLFEAIVSGGAPDRAPLLAPLAPRPVVVPPKPKPVVRPTVLSKPRVSAPHVPKPPKKEATSPLFGRGNGKPTVFSGCTGLNWSAVAAVQLPERQGLCRWPLTCDAPSAGRFCTEHQGMLRR